MDTINLDDIGLVLEGGGFRGIYTAAAVDAFHKENLFFDYVVAVSAGAAYGVSYVARQYKRNLEVNPFVADKRYCSWRNFFRDGNYFDWDFMYRHIPSHLIPFDYDKFNKSSTQMKVVVTNCRTGQAEYKDLQPSSPERFRDLLAATSSLPYISRIISIDNQHYMDGGMADSIPIQKAFEDGNKRLVVVLTRNVGYQKTPMKGKILLKLIYRKYPKMVKAMLNRHHNYNQMLNKLEQLEKEGKVFIIRPITPIAVSRMENKPEKLEKAYQQAEMELNTIIPKLKKWLEGAE